MFDARTHLCVWRCRAWCEGCGEPKLERLDWRERYARVTDRLAESVARLAVQAGFTDGVKQHAA